ncbi:putative alpha-E superfamily protein [Alkalispirillum mobile]|uniref:Putative alpha-E superfamily protein n=1 Tax=Alkalispirillum mobile TaxID=85925 RepID=A0A498CER2_9GAMM|nr:alpha-E domain-containing protein [Alkalispirillum mobile]RLK50918.1 putative alpha-E superfamily protein [Alkalispirillum mobile]
MLSRLAENIYWLARYLERTEDTARLLLASAQIQMDLPSGMPMSWHSLLEILGASEPYRARHGSENERAVMRFLISDPAYSGSIAASVRSARENARVTRDQLPREAWEAINGLHYLLQEQAPNAIASRWRRNDLLAAIAAQCQRIQGVLHGSVSRGPRYQFIALGRYLERADMTTRILDVRYASLFPMDGDGNDSYYSSVCWISVLRSLSAYEMYRQDLHGLVRGRDVVHYLLQGERSPRAVGFALARIRQCLEGLPNHQQPAARLEALQAVLATASLVDLSPDAMHEFIDGLQQGFAALHGDVVQTYFRFTP